MPDITVSNHGSVVMIGVHSDAAREWVADNLALESWQWMGHAFACEPRCVENLLHGMTNDGLEVDANA